MEILDYKNSLREGPPRKVSLASTIKVLFDDYTVQVGAAILMVGIFFMQISVGQSLFVELVNFNGDWVQTNGRLMDSENYTPDRYKHVFEFSVDNELYEGTSYGIMGIREATENCLVEYRAYNPRRSRVVGTSAEVFPALAGCCLLAPLLGLVILLIGLRKKFKALYLLKYGLVTQGKTLSVTSVMASGGGRAYRFVFEFKVNDKTYEASCISKEKERVEDDDLYNVLYKENNPSKNIVYDALGHVPEIGKLGDIKEGNPASTFYLGLIFIMLLVNLYFYSKWYW